MVEYLTVEHLIEINKEVLKEVKVKKADSFKVLSLLKLRRLTEDVEAANGDLYDKAVVLLKGLIQYHPFASGNRRASVVAVLEFLKRNGEEIKLSLNPKVLQGIRESYYTDKEIKDWLIGGDIRDFKRK